MAVNRAEVLADLDFLSGLTSAIPQLPEPASEPVPIVAIQYSPNFKFVMGMYNALNDMSRSGQLTEDLTPSWLLTLAYAIQSCPPHYSAWQQRREIVFSQTRFMAAMVESSQFFMTPEVAEVLRKTAEVGGELVDCEAPAGAGTTNWRFHAVSSSVVGDSQPPEMAEAKPVVVLPTSELLATDRERLACLLPSLTHDTVDGTHSLWHAIKWELSQTAQLARANHKNFQIWHHRKELIARGLQEAAMLGGTPAFTSADDVLFNDKRNALSFADIDERVLCDEVFKKDSKNYHVWQHRAWFVSAFPFLHQVDVSQSLNGSCASSPEQTFSRIRSTFDDPVGQSVLQLHSATLDNCRRLPRGMTFRGSSLAAASPIQHEIDYTSILISDDVFNNSAWSYRMHLVEQYVWPAFDKLICGATSAPHVAEAQRDELMAAVTHCVNFFLEEMSYAVTEAAAEVCNECAFVYARGMCGLWRRAVASWGSEVRAALAAVLQQCDTDHIIDGDDEWLATIMLRTLMHALFEDVMPVVRQVKKEVSQPQTPYGQRTMFVRNNTHQCEAVLFHLAADVCEVLVAEVRRVGEIIPDGAALMATVAMAPADFESHLRAMAASVAGQRLLAYERICLTLGKRLFEDDRIRLKYWRFEVKRIAFREY